jgi:hypothetical protein
MVQACCRFADKLGGIPEPIGGIGAMIAVLGRLDAIQEVAMNDRLARGGDGSEER